MKAKYFLVWEMLHFHISFVLRAEFFVLKIYLIEDFVVRAPLQSSWFMYQPSWVKLELVLGLEYEGIFIPRLSSWQRQLNKTAGVETSAFEGKLVDLFYMLIKSRK